MFNKIMNKIRAFTPKQVIVAGVFTLALAAAIGGGMALKQSANAQEIRDCDDGNSIINVGACGALTPAELAADVRSNKPSDLQAIYADSRIGGLQGEEDYTRFEKFARPGVIKRTGDVVVDGEVVMTDAWTMGRYSYSKPGRVPIVINGVTYYTSHPSISFAQHRQELDVMVLFDKNGTVEIAIMEACGNPITQGKKVTSDATCDDLKSHPVAGKDNTYTFTTNVSKTGLAKIEKVEYYIDGKLWKTETDPAKHTAEYTFTKSADVSVKVYVKLPGLQQKVVESAKCKKHIEFKKIVYTCKALIATARDNTNRKFRFTVNTEQSPNVTLKDVDFTLDNKVTVTGVTDKDAQGNIYKDYDFADSVEHTISAKVKFTYQGETVTAPELCVAKVTPEKVLECPEKPGSGLPPGHPDCQPKKVECPEKPGSGYPVGDPRCKELPKTGPGSLVGLFAGASIAGSAAHRLFIRFKSRDEQ